ncbi:nucleotide diphosphatase/phosphodiesterase NPP2 [Saccharomyces eubayanus]|uniref:nucleotide diphosphatase/phosphodiesterase NPP2 n=1 Tax=Saccharomyces eubayanus TaxID=1080349 RepID=UPI0006C2C871|nr:NPP2-like protein [Saccharomyces eubayanus]KOG99928.1 NPP2-like protein [Saccharomyces eubayanus]
MLLLEQGRRDLEKNDQNGVKARAPTTWSWLWKSVLCGMTVVMLLSCDKRSARYDAGPREIVHRSSTYFNGTHEFKTLTILISIDGFLPRLIDEKCTPFLYSLHNLQSPYDINISTAPHMIPSFPTQTFPNHWSMVTGKYPIEHGIISNVFWDDATNSEFQPNNLDPRIWSNAADPIWQLLQTQSQNEYKVATHMWPGSDVTYNDCEEMPRERMPFYFDKFNQWEPLDEKLSQIFRYVDMPQLKDRPELILSYVPNIDWYGHNFGYDLRDKRLQDLIGEVDGFCHELIEGLQKRNLLALSNVMFVSDHGMSNVDMNNVENIVVWEKMFPDGAMSKYVSHLYNEGPMMMVYLEDPRDRRWMRDLIEFTLRKVYGEEISSKFHVILREDFEPDWKYFRYDDKPHAYDDRVGDIWVLADAHCAILKETGDVRAGVMGTHGYNFANCSDMASMFIGMGPMFNNGVIPPFENTEIYKLLIEASGVV